MAIFYVIICLLSAMIAMLALTVNERQKECRAREKTIKELKGKLEYLHKQPELQKTVIATKEPIDIRATRVLPYDYNGMPTDEKLREDMEREIFEGVVPFIEFQVTYNPVQMERNIYARLSILKRC